MRLLAPMPSPPRAIPVLEKDPFVVPSAALELVPEGPVLPNLASVKLRRDDKEEFDRLQAWWSCQAGRQLTQWEAFTLLLAAAYESESTRVPRR